MSNTNKIDAHSLTKYLTELRRDFHKYPEPGWIEYRTSAKIADELERFGYNVYVGKDVCESIFRMGVPDEKELKSNEKRALKQGANEKWIKQMKGGQTGVVGVLNTGVPGPTIALRFDIDALYIVESINKSHFPNIKGFSSIHDCMMHACGHDGHAAIGLGVAKLLAEEGLTKGEVRLLFQPAEEGCRGANSMVQQGWLNNVNYFYSGHIGFQSFKLGEVVASSGGFLATTKINVTFEGKSAHAGFLPECGRNALLAAASASLYLHAIPRHSKGITRINVGKLNAGSSRNIIPNLATMEIETRGETTDLNNYMKDQTLRIVENVAKTYDVSFKIDVVGEASEVLSSKRLMNFINKELKTLDEVTSIIEYKDFNASEDITYMMNHVQEQGGKASYLLFGSPLSAKHHETQFDYDERVLNIGVKVFLHLIRTSSKQ